MIHKKSLVASLAFLFLASTTPAALAGPAPVLSPLNVNGTWEGKASCKGMDSSGNLVKKDHDFVVRMVIDLAEVRVAMEFEDGTGTARGFKGPDGLCGLAVEQLGKPGKGLVTVGAVTVDTELYEDEFRVMGLHFKTAKVDDEGGGKLVGSGPVLWWLDTQVGACKISLKRTNTATPEIAEELRDACLLTTP